MKIKIRFHEPRFSKSSIAQYRRGSDLGSMLPINVPELFWVLAPGFRFSRSGLYLRGVHLSEKGKVVSDSALQRELGKSTAEGAVNHIHLSEIVQNPVAQFLLGASAIAMWAQALQSIKKLRAPAIYLSEVNEGKLSTGFILCVYSDPSAAEIKEMEDSWKRKPKVLEFSKFASWLEAKRASGAWA